jgi:hypothetical protein
MPLAVILAMHPPRLLRQALLVVARRYPIVRCQRAPDDKECELNNPLQALRLLVPISLILAVSTPTVSKPCSSQTTQARAQDHRQLSLHRALAVVQDHLRGLRPSAGARLVESFPGSVDALINGSLESTLRFSSQAVLAQPFEAGARLDSQAALDPHRRSQLDLNHPGLLKMDPAQVCRRQTDLTCLVAEPPGTLKKRGMLEAV